jgi:HemY protein
MHWLISFLVVFALAVVVSLAIRYGEGYALLVYPPYRVEISLTLLLVALVAFFVLIHGLVRLTAHTVRLPATVATARRRRRMSRAQAALRNAWHAFLEGRYGQSEKFAAKAYDLEEAPALAALLAARSAHEMRDPERREQWLARAEQSDGASRTARLATQAELALEERRFEEARALLGELHGAGPRHVATLKLLLRAEQGLQNWDEVLRIQRLLEKRGAINPELAAQLRITATIENLKKKALDVESLEAFWRKVPAADKVEPRIAQAAARLFIDLGGCGQAHAAIREALEATWSSDLVALYAECDAADDALERLEQCERWLAAHPRDAALLFTLGRLCAARELWGKATSFLDASLSIQPTRRTHIALAQLYERVGRDAEANRHYRAAADPALAA